MKIQIITEDYPIIYLGKLTPSIELNNHRKQEELDHPDGSVSKKKLSSEIKDLLDTQADYNQNDETQPDYIKNRPFYETVFFLGEGDIQPHRGELYLSEPLEEGDTVYYECHWPDGTESVGSDVYPGGAQFAFCNNKLHYYSVGPYIVLIYGDINATVHIKISKLGAVRLPEKYLPKGLSAMHTIKFYENPRFTSYCTIVVPHNGQIVIPKHYMVASEINGSLADKAVCVYNTLDETWSGGGWSFAPEDLIDTKGEFVSWLTRTGGVQSESDAYDVIGIVKGDCSIVVRYYE